MWRGWALNRWRCLCKWAAWRGWPGIVSGESSGILAMGILDMGILDMGVLDKDQA
jgi:hypothetical protein